MNVVVTGSIAFDYIMSFPGRFREHLLPDQLDNISLSFLVDSMKKQRGGCAANIAYNLALLGERPLLMATAGQDFGEYRKWLDQHGVDTSPVREYPDEFTSSFFVSTDLDQSQIASFYIGAMGRAGELSFKQLAVRPDVVIISPNDPKAMTQYVRECKELGIQYIYDPSQQIVRLSDDDLREGIDDSAITITNDYEFEMLRNRLHMAEAAFLDCAQVLIITRGADGSTILTREQRYDVPAVPTARPIDPTGVGDAYRAGLIRGLALGLPWDTIGRVAALAATYVLENHGPQNHRYTREEFTQRYRTQFGNGGLSGL
ncbi:MAG: carbohydrate kinase family protein [Chloroflexi bacterium]|nr:carbohydrate kinase family protein [Chloroflexota bacterium]